MGFEGDLVAGHALLIAAADLGTWSPAGIYTAGQIGIYDQVMPESADSMIALSTYSVGNDPSQSDSVIGLQVRTRRPGPDPRTCRDLDGAIFDLLHGRYGYSATGIRVEQCLWQSGAPLGQDESARWNWVTNFYLTLHRPSPHRT